ncbi:uncharacterized protein DUF3429 [Litoreibacter ponti]|uniref:Uncharacterized protein DUF3429 n=1 Tax=Litoreibacter ponti TaxID=1510457 RepID=A0A2T6BMK9_9RHOB|nr:DUF3429 domain-containing protein [Litoreibacter ponti]PTX57313.1 uncharacterized protein DUF3429 [Litoreibacter ponti]
MIPRPALYLGLAGLLPFLWGALGTLVPAIDQFTVSALGQRFNAGFILVSYGTVILCFMSGVLWGFATKTNEFKAFSLSTMPALWAFFTVGGGQDRAISAVLIGFLLVFACDVQFRLWGLAPDWWLKLRTLLTAIVAACLAIGLLA